MKGCLPTGVLTLGYQPEMDAPAILNGSSPWDAAEDVPATVLYLPQPATTSPHGARGPLCSNLHARTVRAFAITTRYWPTLKQMHVILYTATAISISKRANFGQLFFSHACPVRNSG